MAGNDYRFVTEWEIPATPHEIAEVPTDRYLVYASVKRLSVSAPAALKQRTPIRCGVTWLIDTIVQ